MSFGSPAPAPTIVQKAAPPAEPPKRTDAEVEEARRKQLELEAQAKGRSSTVLTGLRGVQAETPVTTKRVLGG